MSFLEIALDHHPQAGSRGETAVNASQAFYDRLIESPVRTGLTLAVLLLVGGLMKSAINLPLAVPAAIGSAWLTWQIYNFVVGGTTPLFVGEPTFVELVDAFVSTGWSFFAAIVGVALGVLVFVLGKRNDHRDEIPVWIRIPAAIGTFISIVLAWSLLVRIFA